MAIIDPRLGDTEDDRSSTKRHSMLSLAGNLLAEVSLPKLIVACILLIVLPGLMLGAAPLIASIWIMGVSAKLSAVLSGIWPVLLLSGFAIVGWFGGRPLFRLAESSFWSLNALVRSARLRAHARNLSPPCRGPSPGRSQQGDGASLRAAWRPRPDW